MSDLLETAELLAFTKTVDVKSLSRAAAELGVPRATIGRRLARLEERLGVRLLRRTTRSLALTDAGEALYRQAAIALDAVRQAEASVQLGDGAIRGDLRVSLPPITDPGFFQMIADFVKLHPAIRLLAHFATEHVDLLRGGYDAALRATTQHEPGLVARTLARAPLIAVASPAYLAERGAPRAARDLAQHRCLMGFARGQVPQVYWPLEGGGNLRVEGCFFSNDINLLASLAAGGLGIALLPAIAIQRELAAGTLVRVLAGVVGVETRIALVYPEREFMPPQLRAFIDAFAAWMPGEKNLHSGLEAKPTKNPSQRKRGTRARKGAKRAR
jgi:DNA-binding transcriptional LysR family regulator